MDLGSCLRTGFRSARLRGRSGRGGTQNGLEAWFGTRPDVFTPGLVVSMSGGGAGNTSGGIDLFRGLPLLRRGNTGRWVVEEGVDVSEKGLDEVRSGEFAGGV